jgi:putative hydrolase of the HAD superfamily
MGLSGQLKAIFFDLDGTLADDGDSIRQALDIACQVIQSRWPELDATALATFYRQMSDVAWGDYDQYLRHLVAPEAMLATVWRTTLARWNLNDSTIERTAAEAYWQHRLKHCNPYSDVFPLIRNLSERFQLCLLTNGAPAMQRAKAEAAGLTPFFHHVFVGGDFERGKPDAAIFRAALTATQCSPMQAAHIGDSLTHDIAGARSVGIHSIWLNRKRLSSIDAPHVPDFEIETLHDLLQCLERVSVSAKLEARS